MKTRQLLGRVGLLMGAVAVLGFTRPALAADFYVSSVSGSDLTGDGSQVNPWGSIRHALTQIPDPPVGQTHQIHAAPGVYSDANGEVFPLVMRPGLQLIGDGGSSQTAIEGGGVDAPLILMESDQFAEAYWFRPDSRIEGFALRDARNGVRLYSNWLPVDPTLRDLEVREMISALYLVVEGDQGAGSIDTTVDEVLLTESGVGLTAVTLGQGILRCAVSDAAVIENSGHGIDAAAASGSTRVTMLRMLVERNGGDGVHAVYVNEGGVTIDAQDCSLSGNGRAGYRGVVNDGLGGAARGIFHSCTVAHNTGPGIVAEQIPVVAIHPTDLTDCIVYGNSRDVVAGPFGFNPVDVRYSDIGTGVYNDLEGNISADPLFWAPEFADYHLKAGSPCIDAGDPAGLLDLDGSVADMGVYTYDSDYAPAPVSFCATAPNSVGSGALIASSGSPSIAVDDFTLLVAAAPPDKFGLFYYGAARIQVPFGDGLRCVGAGQVGTFRLNPPQTTDALGTATRPLDFSTPPAGGGAGVILPGSSWNFQFWYRDPAGPGGSGFNLSDGLVAWFLP